MAIDQRKSTIPCLCGCGQFPTINPRTNKPFRFLQGHHRRGLTTSTYRKVGYNAVHRLRAEAALGHPLPAKAVIHHPDEDPWNPNARLVICEDQKYHFVLHVRMRVKAAGGNPNTDKICSACQQVKPKTAFYPNRGKPDGFTDSCRECFKARMMTYHRRTRKSRQAQPQSRIDSDADETDTNTL